MWFDNDVQKKYPKCVSFAKTELQPDQLSINYPMVWFAYSRACNPKNQKWARTALIYGSGPQVVVGPSTIYSRDFNNNQVEVCGVNLPPGKSQYIAIISKLFDAYEFCISEKDTVLN